MGEVEVYIRKLGDLLCDMTEVNLQARTRGQYLSYTAAAYNIHGAIAFLTDEYSRGRHSRREPSS